MDSDEDDDSSDDDDMDRYEQCKTSSKVSTTQIIKKKINADAFIQEQNTVIKKSELKKLKEELEFSLEEIMEQHLMAILDCE